MFRIVKFLLFLALLAILLGSVYVVLQPSDTFTDKPVNEQQILIENVRDTYVLCGISPSCWKVQGSLLFILFLIFGYIAFVLSMDVLSAPVHLVAPEFVPLGAGTETQIWLAIGALELVVVATKADREWLDEFKSSRQARQRFYDDQKAKKHRF